MVTTSQRARRLQIFVAVFVSVALLLRLTLTTFDPAADDPTLLTRWLHYISYFTIQSNIACLLAALAVLFVDRLETKLQRALRLASLAGITITCIVYITILAGDSNEAGLSQVANLMLHYIGPPLVVLAWLVGGPRVGLTWSDIPRAMIWPLLWTVWTLLHGAVAGWYPYGFVDVDEHGYGSVMVTLATIFAFAVFVMAVWVASDRLLTRRGSAPPGSPRSAPR